MHKLAAICAALCVAAALPAIAANTAHHKKLSPKHAAPMAMKMAAPAAEDEPVKPGCAYGPVDIDKWGKRPFINAPVIGPDANNVLTAKLAVVYGDNEIAGCMTHLRTYNGALVGPTYRVKPDTVMNVTLENALPKDGNPCPMHHSNTPGMGFNITNLHVHGLHVSPKGNSDNVLLQLCPQDKPFAYQFNLPGQSKQPPGTNWYHAHLHGSTALQVSSGVEGAIIVEGGQDNLPQIAAAKQQVMVLQEIAYDEQGVIENYDNIGAWDYEQRAITINGQVAPVISMRPGEVQYWRLIDGGVAESMPLYITDGHGTYVPMHEIATDGNALGHMDSWANGKPLDLEPGYRSDVLIKAPMLASGQTSATYYVTTAPVVGTRRLQALLPDPGDENSADLTAAVNGVAPSQTIAVIEVSGAPNDMALPTDQDLAPFRFFKDIADDELTGVPQKIDFASGTVKCPQDPRQACTFCDSGETGCSRQFMVNMVPYTELAKRQLVLGTASQWTITTDPKSSSGQHPFHIHVNPFELVRKGPDGNDEKIWKDTILVTKDQPYVLRSRYEDFDGTFVLHCHILNHEDKGMMEQVQIVVPDVPHVLHGSKKH